MKRIRMVVANTKPDPTGRLPTFTPEALRRIAQTKDRIHVYLDFNSRTIRDLMGTVTRFVYDEGREELIAEVALLPNAEIPEGYLPALGYIWDLETQSIQKITSIGLTQEPAKPGTRFLEADDST